VTRVQRILPVSILLMVVAVVYALSPAQAG